jgi:hypothetical protein
MKIQRSIFWYGEEGTTSPFDVGHLPEPLAQRYRASGRVRVTREPRTVEILTMTVTDRETGARVKGTRRADQPERVTMTVSGDVSAEYVTQLWKDARDILALARRQLGGAPRGTGITVSDLVASAIRLREPDGTWPTEEAVAEHLDVSARRIRQVAAEVKGWSRILELAADIR